MSVKPRKTKATGSFYPWSEKDLVTVRKLQSAKDIQAYLDRLAYNLEGTPRIPGQVIKHKQAHCFDGALFAASVFSYHGEQPLILDLCAARDDDHILALYRSGKHYGAVAKSNYTGLRFREPIFKSIRELVLSYFESYFNLQREKSLRSYSEVLNLNVLGKLNWQLDDQLFEQIAQRLVVLPHHHILAKGQEKMLAKVDTRTFAAGLVGLRKS